MAYDAINKTTAAGATPEPVLKAVADYLRGYEGFNKTVTDYSSEIKGMQQGDVFHIASIGALTAETIDPGSGNLPHEAQVNTNVDNSLAMDQWKGVPLSIPDPVQIQANQKLVDIYAEHASAALWDAAEAYLTASVIQGDTTNNVDAGTDNVCTDTELRSLVAKLKADKVPFPSGCYAGANPAVWAAWLGEEFNQYQITGQPYGTPLQPYGCPAYGSHNWAETASDGIEIVTVWHKSAVAFGMQLEPKMLIAPAPLAYGYEVSFSTIYGATLLFGERTASVTNTGS